jgi:hypothetical protein
LTATNIVGYTSTTTFTVTVLKAPTFVTLPNKPYVKLGVASVPVQYQVTDAITALSSLQVAASGNPGDTLTVTQPTASGVGTVSVTAATLGADTITITVTDPTIPGLSTSSSFVTTADSAPSITTTIPNQALTMGTNATTGPLSFTVSDPVSADPITLSAASSNPTLVPVSGITFTGPTAGHCTVTVTPAQHTGVATITVTATNGALNSASTTFTVTVLKAPTITLSPTSLTLAAKTSANSTYTVSDTVNPVTSLVMSVISSSNTSVVPLDATHISITQPNSNGMGNVIVTPIAKGSSTITVQVTDPTLPGLSSTTTLTVTAN